VVFCSHWQGFYGLHNDDRRGFRVLQTLLTRLRELDPRGELTRWRKCSEITNYACAREMATVQVDGDTVRLHLPIAVPELTLQITGTDVQAVTANGVPLRQAANRAAFESGTYLKTDEGALVAVDGRAGQTEIAVA